MALDADDVDQLSTTPGATATSTGRVLRDDVPERHADAPLDTVLPEEEFLDHACRAATGG